MAAFVVKGLSDLLGLNIVVNEAASSEQTVHILDLECLHKYSLHWITSTPTSTSASKLANPSIGNTVTNKKQPSVAIATVPPTPTSAEPSEIKLTIKTLTGRATVLNINNSSSVSQLKDMIHQKDDVQAHLQKLMYQNKKLEDEKPLSHYNITNNSTLFLIVSLKSSESYRMVPENFLDSRYDYVYSNSDAGKSFVRGNRKFIRPCGWTKKALMVLGKYGSDTWLGVTGRQSERDSAGGEWPVAYHGTKKDHAEAICKQGVRKSQGRLYVPGKGIYTTPSPVLAEQQSETFEFEGCKYKMIFMDRVQMDYTSEFEVQGIGSYFITSNENSVRPYCILLKKF